MAETNVPLIACPFISRSESGEFVICSKKNGKQLRRIATTPEGAVPDGCSTKFALEACAAHQEAIAVERARYEAARASGRLRYDRSGFRSYRNLFRKQNEHQND